MESIDKFGFNRDLLALLRDIDGRSSKKSNYFRLLVHIRLSKDDPMYGKADGCFITYDVVSETAEKALVFVAEFENYYAAPAELRIEESEVLEKRPNDPMGVYRRAGRSYYKDEA
jgi:hypothetical protein